jgi:P27 family predicted phage terminase small subunit
MAGTGNSGGRNKVSAQTHVVLGTFNTTRHTGEAAPEPPAGTPDIPKGLEGDALAEWQRMVARLEVSGTLSKVDDAAIYQYALLFAETEDAARMRREAGDTARILRENFDGNEKLDFADQLAAAQEINKSMKLEASYATSVRQGRMAIRQYLVEFGMTPAARSRVKASPKKELSKAEQFRQRKGA